MTWGEKISTVSSKHFWDTLEIHLTSQDLAILPFYNLLHCAQSWGHKEALWAIRNSKTAGRSSLIPESTLVGTYCIIVLTSYRRMVTITITIKRNKRTFIGRLKFPPVSPETALMLWRLNLSHCLDDTSLHVLPKRFSLLCWICMIYNRI